MVIRYFACVMLLNGMLCDGRIGAFSTQSLADKVTIITTTSPIKSNPKTSILEETQKSLFLVPALRDCKKIIVFDGINNKGYEGHHNGQPNVVVDAEIVKERYDEFKRRVIALTEDSSNPYFKNTILLFLDEYMHQAWALREAMKLVDTPFVWIHQHDVLLLREFDAVNLIRTMEKNPRIKHVRICGGENSPNYYDGPVDTNIQGVSYIPLVRTFRFSDAEHFTTVKYYKELVFPRVHGHGFSEYWMMEPDFKKHQLEIYNNHDLYGTYVHGHMGEASYFKHLDGRHAE